MSPYYTLNFLNVREIPIINKFWIFKKSKNIDNKRKREREKELKQEREVKRKRGKKEENALCNTNHSKTKVPTTQTPLRSVDIRRSSAHTCGSCTNI